MPSSQSKVAPPVSLLICGCSGKLSGTVLALAHFCLEQLLRDLLEHFVDRLLYFQAVVVPDRLCARGSGGGSGCVAISSCAEKMHAKQAD